MTPKNSDQRIACACRVVSRSASVSVLRFDKFSGELSEAISSLSGGIELKSIDPQYDLDPRTVASHDIVTSGRPQNGCVC